MTAAKKVEVIHVNTAITEHKKYEKMVKSVISSESNVSKEGKAVITSLCLLYMASMTCLEKNLMSQ